MRTEHARKLIAASLVGAAGVCASSAALASNPLEYPDNGSASFSRGGAWLAVGNEPIAAHYNPAALATQGSGFSIEQQLNFDHVCYNRTGPGDSVVGPNDQFTTNVDGKAVPIRDYLPTCNTRGSFPSTIPSISLAWRASKKLGFGLAIVPPATYGTPKGAFPLTAPGYNNITKQVEQMPAPYRYMQTDNQSTIIFPTLSFGWEAFKHFRVGAGFISGIAVIDLDTAGGTTTGNSPATEVGDHMTDDGFAHLLTKDLFVPGVVFSVHYSVLPQLDISVWGRWLDSVQTHTGDFTLTTNIFLPNAQVAPVCTKPNVADCPGGTAAPNRFVGATNALTLFKYTIPPELRAGVRFHQPRTKALIAFDSDNVIRDPLTQDLFDVELDGSVSFNSMADNIVTRFPEQGGTGAIQTHPTGVYLPPNADRPTGYKDSYGLRVGGQWNAVPNKFALRAGGWFESQSVDPAYMTIFPVGATRWGYGGGFVLRQDFIDISFGYQRHESAGQNNHGDGKMLVAVGTGFEQPAFNTANHIPGRTEFRTEHAVNGGHITESAHVFTLGGTVHF